MADVYSEDVFERLPDGRMILVGRKGQPIPRQSRRFTLANQGLPPAARPDETKEQPRRRPAPPIQQPAPPTGPPASTAGADKEKDPK